MILTTSIGVGQDGDGERLVLLEQLALELARQNGETVTVLLLLLVLELAVAEGLLEAVPERAEGAASLLHLDRRPLPGQVDTVELVVREQPVHRVDELVAGLRGLGLELEGVFYFTRELKNSLANQFIAR